MRSLLSQPSKMLNPYAAPPQIQMLHPEPLMCNIPGFTAEASYCSAPHRCDPGAKRYYWETRVVVSHSSFVFNKTMTIPQVFPK